MGRHDCAVPAVPAHGQTARRREATPRGREAHGPRVRSGRGKAGRGRVRGRPPAGRSRTNSDSVSAADSESPPPPHTCALAGRGRPELNVRLALEGSTMVPTAHSHLARPRLGPAWGCWRRASPCTATGSLGRRGRRGQGSTRHNNSPIAGECPRQGPRPRLWLGDREESVRGPRHGRATLVPPGPSGQARQCPRKGQKTSIAVGRAPVRVRYGSAQPLGRADEHGIDGSADQTRRHARRRESRRAHG